jgi:hypothetical protein
VCEEFIEFGVSSDSRVCKVDKGTLTLFQETVTEQVLPFATATQIVSFI